MQTPELRRMSLNGAALMLVGLGLAFFELRTDFMLSRLGIGGRIVILLCGTSFSVWGLKNIIVSFLPQMAGRGLMFRLPKEGAFFLLITIVLLVGALIGRNNLLMMVFCVMVSLFVINGKFTFTMLRRLHVRRRLPERVMAGDTFVVTMELENRKSWLSAWMMQLKDEVTHTSGTLSPEVLFVRIPPRGVMRGHYQLRLRERGRYHFGPVAVLTRFPFGLVERGVGLDVDDEILVYPRLGHLRPNWRHKLPFSAALASRLKPSLGPFHDEMHRLREYRPGDDVRMIHWRTSARMNELMVQEYHESRDRDLLLIVDAWLPLYSSPEERESIERGLRFAATVCVDYLQENRQTSLAVRLVGRRTEDWGGELAEYHSLRLLDQFALLEPDHHDFSRLRGGLPWEHHSQSRVLIVSSRPEAVRQEFLPTLPLGSGDVAVVGMSDRELSGMFQDEGAVPYVA